MNYAICNTCGEQIHQLSKQDNGYFAGNEGWVHSRTLSAICERYAYPKNHELVLSQDLFNRG